MREQASVWSLMGCSKTISWPLTFWVSLLPSMPMRSTRPLAMSFSPSMSTSWYFKEEEPALTIRIFIGRSPYLLLTPAP